MSVLPPPVPSRLVEMLSGYPEHVERLREVLSGVLKYPPSVTPRAERAVLALEGRLEAFSSEARRELEAATASGDASAVVQAEAKYKVMSRLLWREAWAYDDDLWSYFEMRADAPE
ncbi:hypothetical protein [Stenotrophomonas sp. CFBP 13725]|uniref:hypothetical protein n=1 Tax=Stenotrophomonas sp. CFBP 13725 TaxID=2775297 RepID=UPI00178460C6|nr:hypothetical protein [Stenotrophomonas sp. CFBP 13725]MBD8637661.1 hypothetical protein [Stenotrophomonas sp. CFBP 13725]